MISPGPLQAREVVEASRRPACELTLLVTIVHIEEAAL